MSKKEYTAHIVNNYMGQACRGKNRTHGMMKQDKQGQLRSMLRVMCENKLA